MPRWASVFNIAGVAFAPACRIVLVDPFNFGSYYRGSIAVAADGTPHIQRVNTGIKNIRFGASMAYASAAMLQNALDAIEAAEMAGTAFRVQAQDALYTIDASVYPDYDQQWYTHGPESEGIIEAVTFRFVALAPFA